MTAGQRELVPMGLGVCVITKVSLKEDENTRLAWEHLPSLVFLPFKNEHLFLL